MSPWIYYSVTLSLYILEILAAIAISDIGNIFGFIGTIAGTSLSFFIPSILYLEGVKAFTTTEY